MNARENILEAVHRALDENDAKVHELTEIIQARDASISQLEAAYQQLATKWDTEREKIIREHAEHVKTLELDVIQVKRRHDAYVEKTSKEIEKLSLSIEAVVKESGSELDHWKRENERLIDAKNRDVIALEKEITVRDTDIQSLIADQSKLVRKHEESLEQMRVLYEASAAHDANVIKTLYTERQSVQDLYQEERALVKKAWEALGYNASSGMPPKSIEELIRDKDVEISTLQKSRETATFEHADHAAALRTEIDRLNARQEIMEVTIARYKGLQDQSDLLLRCADAMEREQYSGSGADIPELIAEVKNKVVSVQ